MRETNKRKKIYSSEDLRRSKKKEIDKGEKNEVDVGRIKFDRI